STVLPDGRTAFMDLAIGPAFHVGVNPHDLVHLEAELAPRWHTLLLTSLADGRHEYFAGRDGATVPERCHQRGCKRGSHRVFPVAPRTVQLKLLPAVVGLATDG